MLTIRWRLACVLVCEGCSHHQSLPTKGLASSIYPRWVIMHPVSWLTGIISPLMPTVIQALAACCQDEQPATVAVRGTASPSWQHKRMNMYHVHGTYMVPQLLQHHALLARPPLLILSAGTYPSLIIKARFCHVLTSADGRSDATNKTTFARWCRWLMRFPISCSRGQQQNHVSRADAIATQPLHNSDMQDHS